MPFSLGGQTADIHPLEIPGYLFISPITWLLILCKMEKLRMMEPYT